MSDLLVNRLGKQLSFADEGVIVLDPAAGTGTYPLVALQHGLDVATERYGPGFAAGSASRMGENIHAFEMLVGPYAVAHLRMSERIMDSGGALPSDGVHVYLTDTLESPYATPKQSSLIAKQLAAEHRRALKVKEHTSVLVCIGNPPYDRQQIDASDVGVERKGAWVRYGEEGMDGKGIIEDFLAPARAAGAGGHLKNLYNDYVYFWRWALWKVFEKEKGPGIVSFITASSYLRGPGFVGMREVMRRTFDDLWIIDLEGDSLGARKTENVFAIRTPVAIAVGVRYGPSDPDKPARVRYTKIQGTRDEKLAELGNIASFSDVAWGGCFEEWQKPFLPLGVGDYFSWPLLTDVFPWQQSGVKIGRTWPVSSDVRSLQERWRRLASSRPSERRQLFKDSPTGKRYDSPVSSKHLPTPASAAPVTHLVSDALVPTTIHYAHRAFDRQWLLADARLIDRSSPALWHVHSKQQIFLTSLLTGVIGLGPAATVTGEIPDLHHFRGSFGGKDVIPLWRDAAATEPNVTHGLLDTLSGVNGETVSPEQLFAYAYAVLASPAYVERFSEELTIPGPRLPLTRDAGLFGRAAGLGRRLVHLHTYGERFGPDGGVQQGRARATRAIPGTPEGYPRTFGYDSAAKTLRVGDGEFGPVELEVWNYSVSGLQVVKSWLAYRMAERAGKASSPLDDIRPERWDGRMTEELLDLLWVLEATVELQPELAALLGEVLESDLVTAGDLPQPTEEEKQPPSTATDVEYGQGTLLTP